MPTGNQGTTNVGMREKKTGGKKKGRRETGKRQIFKEASGEKKL